MAPMQLASKRVTAAAIAAAVAATLSGVAVSLWANAADGKALGTPALLAAGELVFLVVGAVIAAARPGNRIGWIILVGVALEALGNAGVDAAYRGIVAAPGSVPAASAWAVIGSSLRAIGFYLITVAVAVVFPDGHIASRRWRWLPWLVAGAIVCSACGTLLAKDANLTDLGSWHNPSSTAHLAGIGGALSGLGLLLGIAAIVGAVGQLVHRWRHGDALLRQQLLLFAVAAALPIIGLLVTALAGTTAPWVFAVSTLPLPVAIGFAVLARGLYDLRTAVNRTLVWLTLSAAIVGVYALVIAGVGSLTIATGATWLPWLAAAAVAISFAPLRDGLQRAVNRITYGRWDEPYDVLSSLGQRLQATADVDGLLLEVERELCDGFGLVDVTISDATGSLLVGGTSTPGADAVCHSLSCYGNQVGVLTYAPPVIPLRERDEQLLDDLSGHLGGLLHARELTTDLQRARERLVLAREEERRRLRRDLHDGLGPALAGHVLRLDIIARRLDPTSAARADTDALRGDLQDTVSDFRKVVEGLRPPALDDLGLAGAVAQVASRFTSATGAAIEVCVEDLPPLPAALEVAAFRIASEAISNAVRHADAAHIRVRVTSTPSLLLIVVIDDGRGITAEDAVRGAGHGLETMRERAEELRGQLRVREDGGTMIIAEIPLPPLERGAEPIPASATRA